VKARVQTVRIVEQAAVTTPRLGDFCILRHARVQRDGRSPSFVR